MFSSQAAVAYRAEQLTFLAGEMHQRMTEPSYGEVLHDLSQTEMVKDPHSDTGSTILELKHRYEKNSKLPKRLVEELALACGGVDGHVRKVEALGERVARHLHLLCRQLRGVGHVVLVEAKLQQGSTIIKKNRHMKNSLTNLLANLIDKEVTRLLPRERLLFLE